MNTLREAVNEYLALRRGLGFRLRAAGKALRKFVSFMEERRATYITSALALEWAQQPADARVATWAQKLTYVRVFARHRSATDPRTQIPPLGLLPYRPQRARPYLEIRRLLRAALNMPRPLHSPYRKSRDLLPWLYYCLFGLLSVTGLRVSEACDLKLQDVDLRAAVLTIRGAKFGKDRLVPLHVSTRNVLAAYIARRERIWAQRPVSSYLFVSCRGNRLDFAEIRRVFYKVSRQIGLRELTASHGPRLHDMRHRFATRTLENWYKSGDDPERRLPTLSAFLGHVHVADTFYYLSASPALMRAAMDRLETRWGNQA
jgi:integrase/recombinase XerD